MIGVSAAMLHTPRSTRRARPANPLRPALAGALAALTLALAACAGGAAAPTTPPAPGATETPQPTPTAVPGPDGNGSGSGGNVGTGILPPGITFPVGQIPDESLLGEAKYLTPTKDLIDQRNVTVQLLRAAIVDDGRAFADLRWYSGVAPCNALDSVKMAKDDAAKTIHLTVVEGSGPGDQMCIEIAELHAVAVDLGVLAAGTWTISAEGDAPAIKLDVP
ncbi:MAG TPA: hypothetical protein VFP56_01060 [Candidatus Limnocylindrales bacterium]|nr:hypothetical protein [Candidatus Limnocylindrales bacterium]